jgi:tetratricopeptide (TPR) repeat protein
MKSGRSDPLILQALCEQGLGLHRSGHLDEAAQLYNRVLRRNPKHPDALHLLGMICVQTGQIERGASLLRQAVRANPNFAAAHAHLGMALWRANRPEEALASYDAALALKPDYVEAHNDRGIVLSALGRHEDALASHDKAIALKADYADGHYNRGVQLHHLTRPEDAVASQERAIALRPDYAEAHNNRGTALYDLGRPEEALSAYDKAIALKPDYAEAHKNRGLALSDLKRLEEALASYDRAITLAPDDADALEGRGLTHLLAGQFEAGWRDYEHRKSKWNEPTHQFDQQRSWSGEFDLDGQTLFVQSEQGLGDTIQFVRFVMLLEDRGVEVALSVQTSLRALLQSAMPSVKVLSEDERPAKFDCRCSLMSLPLAFGTTLASIPPQPRCLVADHERRAHFEALLGPGVRPRIGIAWSGNPAHRNDHNRSIAFEQLQPLLSAGADWIALQNGVRASDAAAFDSCGRVDFLGDELTDFSDTAALLDLMDVVVTVDTSIAHLAGAMGKPVWILLPFSPDWRWMLDRRDSPWYPTARLFRQPRIGDWESVIDEVRRDFHRWTVEVGRSAPQP